MSIGPRNPCCGIRGACARRDALKRFERLDGRARGAQGIAVHLGELKRLRRRVDDARRLLLGQQRLAQL
jgi:hypothetical protein